MKVPDLAKASCRLAMFSFFSKPTLGAGLVGDATVTDCECVGGKTNTLKERMGEIYSGTSLKDTLKNKGHLSIEDTVYCPNYIKLCTKLPLN